MLPCLNSNGTNAVSVATTSSLPWADAVDTAPSRAADAPISTAATFALIMELSSWGLLRPQPFVVRGYHLRVRAAWVIRRGPADHLNAYVPRRHPPAGHYNQTRSDPRQELAVNCQ
ncbi:Uncharacterised protein [Bordetella pertussis]|nr:Uncharacterised protein [Bordetella pertussis]